MPPFDAVLKNSERSCGWPGGTYGYVPHALHSKQMPKQATFASWTSRRGGRESVPDVGGKRHWMPVYRGPWLLWRAASLLRHPNNPLNRQQVFPYGLGWSAREPADWRGRILGWSRIGCHCFWWRPGVHYVCMKGSRKVGKEKGRTANDCYDSLCPKIQGIQNLGKAISLIGVPKCFRLRLPFRSCVIWLILFPTPKTAEHKSQWDREADLHCLNMTVREKAGGLRVSRFQGKLLYQPEKEAAEFAEAYRGSAGHESDLPIIHTKWCGRREADIRNSEEAVEWHIFRNYRRYPNA